MDEFIDRICAEHDVRSVGVSMYGKHLAQPFTVYLHWNGEVASGNGNSVDEALACAVAEMRERRVEVAA